LNAEKDAELKGKSTSENRQEPPPTAANCAPGGTILKKPQQRASEGRKRARGRGVRGRPRTLVEYGVPDGI